MKPQFPEVHVRVEFAATWQTLPHKPQLFTSLERFTHVPSQAVSGGAQAITQAPPWHASPALQAVVQFPQYAGSVCVFTQPLLPHKV